MPISNLSAASGIKAADVTHRCLDGGNRKDDSLILVITPDNSSLTFQHIYMSLIHVHINIGFGADTISPSGPQVNNSSSISLASVHTSENTLLL